jgi:membrane protein YqaA with SNARE-associated domain
VLVCFALTVASAILPWLNAEIIVLALPAVAHSRWALAVLVVTAVAGQMAGKCVVYWAGLNSVRAASPRMTRALERWRGRMTRRPSSATTIVLLSSLVGFPPFFLITAIAGALKLRFSAFLAAGTAGRLIRFGALVFVPPLVASWLR